MSRNRIVVGVGERERRDTRPFRHLVLAHLPVHGFSRTPRDGHLFGDLGPHVGLESLVQPSKFIFAVLIPFTSSLQVVLVVKSTRDSTPTRQMFADVLPLHTLAPKLNDLCIFLGRPFGLLLCWRFGSQG